MKTAMIGQDIPVLLPTLLADLLFAGKETGAELAAEEGNPAMREVLQGFSSSVGLGPLVRTMEALTICPRISSGAAETPHSRT